MKENQKMKLTIKLIFFMKLIEINCIKPNDFCQKNELMNEKCFGKYKIQCETKLICTNNKKHCEIFDLKSSLSKKKVIENRKKYVRIVNYLRKTIPKCKDYTNKYCLNSNDCFIQTKQIAFKSLIGLKTNKVDCQCRGLFKHKCNRDFCAINSESCKIIQKINLNRFKTKKCGNKQNYTRSQIIRIRF
jgi:hypothetical protein